MKDIGQPDAGKLHVRFDEGRLINDQSGGHVVAACGKASAKVPDQWSDISFLLYPEFLPGTIGDKPVGHAG